MLFKSLIQSVIQLFYILAVLIRFVALINISFFISLLYRLFQLLK
jgi:hypothetical protein